MTTPSNLPSWPDLNYERDHDTFETLHLFTQVVGKIRLARTPWLNHSWHVPLYTSARGLTTALIPHPVAPFELEFDFVSSRLALRTAAGDTASLPLVPGSVASFHVQVIEALDRCHVATTFDGTPNELPDPIPFAKDVAARAYDEDAARRLWSALLHSDAVLKRFRTGFLGKASPVHFFWGSFDLAVTRFSGRSAPRHAGGIPHLSDRVVREAYSHEVSSAGFWPGGPNKPYPLFYSYAYPEPPGFRNAPMPQDAHFDSDLQEYVLPYDRVKEAPDPANTLFAFVQATYSAAAESGAWDRGALECPFGQPRVVRPV
jgi:Family of unknown function (DUF5996)